MAIPMNALPQARNNLPTHESSSAMKRADSSTKAGAPKVAAKAQAHAENAASAPSGPSATDTSVNPFAREFNQD